ncbi:MAG: bifunctional shikimate kinase/3-dehydroquinate synthase, partial [Thermoleophilia bacterium]|nr:bifunctional shikimate kinase/3-dehydroquinate synthase [Thermoleophilia bacterium]
MTANGRDARIDFDPTASSATRVVLVGFMGAGKTALAERWARSGGPVLWFDSDRAALTRLGQTSVTRAFDELGEPAFRAAERDVILERSEPLARGVEVWSLGGGSLLDADVRGALADACVVWLDATADALWERVAGSDRPLARDWEAFRALHAERQKLYEGIATVRVDATAPIESLGIGRILADHLPPNWFGSGLAVGDGLVERLSDLAALCSGPIAIVSDQAVDQIATSVRAQLDAAGIEVVSDERIPMGEWNKQMSTVEHLLVTWAGTGLHRRGTVVAIGGGTLLDTTGFAASIYQRGIDWVSVPTTLTSQVDAGIGGKTGVNLGVAKNVLGSVHMPRATLIDSSLGDSLPSEIVRDGFVEAAKTGLVAGEWLHARARAVADAPSGDRHAEWRTLIEGCAGFKDAVVSEDPFDTEGVRAQLNLGHTFGHTIEAATGGAVSHGAAVAIGVHAALRLSELVLDAPAALADEWQQLCMRMGVVVSSTLQWEELEPFLALDKKRDEGGINWVLLAGVGQPVTEVRLPLEAARRVWEDHIQVTPNDDGPRPIESASPR